MNEDSAPPVDEAVGPEPPDQAEPTDPDGSGADEAKAEQPMRVAQSRGPSSAAEREFIRRYAEDFPPHHESRWG